MSSVRLLVGATVAAALLSGCTGGPEAAPPSPTPETTVDVTPSTPTPTPEEQTIRFAVYGPPEQIESYRDLAQAFMRNNPHLTVRVEASLDPENAFAELQQDFAAGTAADVFLVSEAYLPRLVAEQRVQPVNHLLDERAVDFGDGYQRDGLVAFSAESALQCMPHDVTPLVVYYNEDLVRFRSLVEEGEEPPTAEDGWSWEQFATAARQAAGGNVKGVYADPGLHTFAPFLWSAGGELVDDHEEPSTLTLSADGNQETFAQVLELLRDPDVTPTEEQLARRDAVNRFKNGELAMILGTRALTPKLRKAENLDFDVFPLPNLGRYRTIAAMSGYCINAETDVLQAAADFLAFAVSREGATITALPGYVVPSNLQVQYSPAFLQPGEQPDDTFVFAEGVRRTNPLPSVPQWPDVVEQTRPLFHRLLHAPVIDLEALLARIDARSRTILPQDESADG